ncbi:hypothetical protein B0J11DRAFT_549003 [Dendryphion nanum]|uniref:Uncharacterized protein n=1 Tax=Dendryphion nanum TaxID=256645 RepID=A0A9P9E4I6_9PLEO|nr:hypothetical protein B0J11DRAFT_549003 [Dendryphion nanum]
MGRKPNQLILEFFERGPKLEDASNRYQHTCKSCGEKFPKGRIDSLTNHLVKKCPILPLRDRQRAILQFHDLPADLPDMAMAAMPGQTHNGPSMNLPFAPSKQGMSALETLAEVSRQQLDLSGARGTGKQRMTPPPQHMHGGNTHGGLLDEFLVQDDRPDGTDSISVSQGFDISSGPALPSIYQFNGPLSHSPTGSPHIQNLPLSNATSIAQMVPSLVMAASQANELSNMLPLANNLTMEPELNMQSGTGISDKFFHSNGRAAWPHVGSSSIDPMLHDHNRDQMMGRDENMNKSMSHHPRPIAMNPNGSQTHFTTDFSMNQKPSKPKVRGRFSDTRRKEVQEVRKRGACIRCRMLKKPCSGDSPCSTCHNVESARLWKQPCIRTRIAEEFGLYAAGLHGLLAFQAINQAKEQVQLAQIPGRIEATNHPESGIFATFTPLKCQAQVLPGSDIDPEILASFAPSQLEIIDSDDDIGGKIDLYIKKVATHFFESEESAFMKTTLESALRITSINNDGLLSKALELWNLTRILTSRNVEWHLFSNPSLAPTIAPASMSSSDLEHPQRTPITTVNNPQAFDLIKMQLEGATEKRAACLSRVVMNDLERRLLQRQQANPFETFLVAVILLACVERMCWLFRKWEDATPSPPAPTQNSEFLNPGPHHDPNHSASHHAPQQHLSSDDTLAQALQSQDDHQISHLQSQLPFDLPAHPPKWPFDKHPAHFSQQGERFSDILNMLLKMRGVSHTLAPRNHDGILVLLGDDLDENVKSWYQGVALTREVLAEKRNKGFNGVGPEEWELKFVSKIVGGGV